MIHHTKNKGDLAAVKAISSLTEKGFYILTPTVSEHLPFDIVGYKDGNFIKFQSKYSSDGICQKKTSWADRNGNHYKEYQIGDFDYYALYLPEKDVVCFPSISFKGCTIRSFPANSSTPFYWYQDFLNLTDHADKKTYKDFGISIIGNKSPRKTSRKVIRPSSEELYHMLWSMTMTDISKKFNVSDKTIAKWAVSYGLKRPKQGYWLKK